MKKVNYEKLGVELSKMVKERYKERYDIEIAFLSENTNDWLEEIRHAEENEHFEFCYNGKVEIFDLEVINDDEYLI